MSLSTVPKRRKRIELPYNQYVVLCRRVMKRDGWKCRVPGCKARQGLNAHHAIFRSHGGDDASYNLVTLCIEHHDAMHAHTLFILPARYGEPLNADKGVRWRFKCLTQT